MQRGYKIGKGSKDLGWKYQNNSKRILTINI